MAGLSAPERLAYRPEEVATLLGLSRTTVYKLMNDGHLPYIKIGTARRVTRRAIEDFLQQWTEGELREAWGK